MNDNVSILSAELVDAVGLHIQELHARGRLHGTEPLLRIDNREQARAAPYQFDAARGQLHRTGCPAIPPGSMSALYGVWQIGPDEESLACPRCNPMLKPDEKTEPKPHDDLPRDLLYGLLSVISQFGGVLRERGQEYRHSRAGAQLGGQIEKIYSGVNERERDILDLLASSLGNLAVVLRDLDEGINGNTGDGPAADAASPEATRQQSGEAP
ncbi:MAG TPA: hypothetical protein VGI79_20625 [Caulobacteraceae bacterium]|jgi:hypothetical protein